MTLTKRAFVNFKSEKMNWAGRLVIHVLIQLLMGAFIPGGDFSQNQVQIKIGGLVLMLMIVSMVPAINIPFYHSEMSLLANEARVLGIDVDLAQAGGHPLARHFLALRAYESRGWGGPVRIL